MNKKITIWSLVMLGLVIVLLGVMYKLSYLNTIVTGDNNSDPENNAQTIAASHDATYTIAGQKVTLKNGISEIEVAPGSASKTITRYFGNEVRTDFDNDGREDSAFIITQNSGGSGTFYYAVARLDKLSGPIGSEAVLLGDRISPQSTNVERNNVVTVNYADRKAGESFAVAPSVGKSIQLLLDANTMQFSKVTSNN